MDVGRCTGHFDSYYFDASTDSCELFQYSGCGGNENRFHSKEECAALCLSAQPAVQPAPGQPGQTGGASSAAGASALSQLSAAARCEPLPDKGPCTQFVTKWFFKKTDGTCTRFYYGGCDGNGNLFTSEQECKDTCGNYLGECMHIRGVLGECEGPGD